MRKYGNGNPVHENCMKNPHLFFQLAKIYEEWITSPKNGTVDDYTEQFRWADFAGLFNEERVIEFIEECGEEIITR